MQASLGRVSPEGREPFSPCQATNACRQLSNEPNQGDRDVEKCPDHHSRCPRRRRRRRDRRYGPSGSGRPEVHELRLRVREMPHMGEQLHLLLPL